MLGVINLSQEINPHNVMENQETKVEQEGQHFFLRSKKDFDLYPTEIRIQIGGCEYFILLNGRIDDRDHLIQKLSLDANKNVSDTYLIGMLYQKFDLEFLKFLDGDFAFSIWDKQINRLILAKDPIGIKNLFYSVDSGSVIWSSAIRNILHIVPKRKVNSAYIKSFLLEHPIANQSTAYENIYRLESGEFLVCENGHIKKDYYYQFKIPSINYRKEEDYFQHFNQLFERSVRNRLRTPDNRVSIPLSGGVDSSSIIAMAENINKNDNWKYNIATYSIVFDEKEADERKYIKSMLDKYNLKSTIVYGDEDWNFKIDFNSLRELDEPYPLFNRALASKTLSAAKSDNISVVLTGHGGDHILHADLNYLGELLKKGKIINYIKELKQWRNKYPLHQILKQNTLDAIFRKNRLEYPSWLKKERFADIDLSTILTKRFEELKWDSKTITAYFNTIIRQTGHEWFDQYLSNPIGVERRYPFLDVKLMEFLAAVPPNLKIRPSNNKYIIRESLKASLPTEIYGRTTKGNHSFLITKGFKEEWNRITEYYDFKILTELGFVNGEEIKEYCERWYMGYRYDLYNASGIMRALALEIWLSDKQDII